MKLARSRPAGNRICLRHDFEAFPDFPGYGVRWVESGTTALALAMCLAKAKRPWCLRPQVVIPAYACPDLVAAAAHAGLEPVLADIGANDPGYRLESLECALNPQTVAVVAVNFLGISERLSELRTLLGRFGDIDLIEDNAQWFPPHDHALSGDYVCLSFGRGKPVSLLGGGALLWRADRKPPVEFDDVAHALPPGRYRGCWEILLYNTLLRPIPYGLISRLPGTRLGVTRLKQLDAIRGFHPGRLALLPANVAAHFARSREVEFELSAMLNTIPQLGNLHADHKTRAERMLRMPVLLPTKSKRDQALQELLKVGIVATKLYGSPLINIPGVRAIAVQSQEAAGAISFSSRLLTLPVHEDIGMGEVAVMRDVLTAVLGR